MRAHQIFESKGLLKLLKEVKNKLKMLNSSMKLAAEMAARDVLESGDDSGKEQSPEKNLAGDAIKMGKGKGKKKVLKKKVVKKTVFRNNFIKESDST